jgi:predicted dithiol-disulfide oxidoreductase (DUF899 family)
MNRAIAGHEVVSSTEWLEARKAFLAREKELTRMRDELSRQRRELPWEQVEKKYVFDGPNGKETLAELFGGKSQLIVYHFMFGPGWLEGCPSCSMLADTFDGTTVHLADRDVMLVAVSRATSPEIERFKKRMGWQFKWVSSNQNDFNDDFNVSFPEDDVAQGTTYYNYATNPFPSTEGPGASVFVKGENGQMFHTYSTYGRGLDMHLTEYNYLDLTPKGRSEEGLPFPMSWVRHHDRYESSANAGATKKESESCCGTGEHA